MLYIFNEKWYTALNNRGWWNAATNTPTIVSGIGTPGDFYIVETSGTTNIDGISDWTSGDWIFYDQSTSTWKKANNASTVWPQWPQWFQWDIWPQGTQGVTWAQWPTGSQWPQWDVGPQGLTWPQGTQGNQGTQWVQWSTGSTWPQGTQWVAWPQWQQGDTWLTWAQGPQGFQWNQGNQGNQGTQWTQGSQWTQWGQWNQWFQWNTWPAGWPTAAYKFSTSLTFPAPSGYIRLSDTAYSTSLQMNVNKTDRNASSVWWWLLGAVSWSVIKIVKESDPTYFAFYSVVSVTDNWSDITYSVTYLSGWTFLLNDDNIVISYAVTGPQWSQWPQWFQGNQWSTWSIWSQWPQGAQWDSANAQLFTWYLT